MSKLTIEKSGDKGAYNLFFEGQNKSSGRFAHLPASTMCTRKEHAKELAHRWNAYEELKRLVRLTTEHTVTFEDAIRVKKILIRALSDLEKGES